MTSRFAKDLLHTMRELGMTDEQIRVEMVKRLPTVRPDTMELEPMPEPDDSQSAIEYQYAKQHDPYCPVCYGVGYYYEDVAGDGGSQMMIECECEQEKENDND